MKTYDLRAFPCRGRKGGDAPAFFDQLLRARRYGKDEAQRILGLLTIYHAADLTGALNRATLYRAFSLSAVERILTSTATPRTPLESVDAAERDHLDRLFRDNPVPPRSTADYQSLLDPSPRDNDPDDPGKSPLICSTKSSPSVTAGDDPPLSSLISTSTVGLPILPMALSLWPYSTASSTEPSSSRSKESPTAPAPPTSPLADHRILAEPFTLPMSPPRNRLHGSRRGAASTAFDGLGTVPIRPLDEQLVRDRGVARSEAGTRGAAAEVGKKSLRGHSDHV